MDREDDVVKWKTIAAALHAGALDDCEGFETLEDAVRHLYNYQTPGPTPDPGGYSRLATDKGHKDFYYHRGEIPGPFGLSGFFGNGVTDRCVLCQHIIMTDEFRYETWYPEDVAQKSVPGSELNLRRLEHLAVMHTPYFVMLFMDLARVKRYSFHRSKASRDRIAGHVFERLRGPDLQSAARALEGLDSLTFLKTWWRFQDRRGSRELQVSIPGYLELHTEGHAWNPRIEPFANRKPEPLYTFLSERCLCHEVWAPRAPARPDVIGSPCRIRTLTQGPVSTYALSVPIPRLHMEEILRSTAIVCNARRAALCNTGPRDAARGTTDCSSALEPRLDCVVLEEVGHPYGMVMHVVTTLGHQWQTLSSWMRSGPDRRLALVTQKVLLAVMGSLREMCLRDMRPSRRFYEEGERKEPKLTTAFFVNGQTGEVLSLLPFVSLSRMYRSRNLPNDEKAFHAACASLAWCISNARLDGETVALEDLRVFKAWWDAQGSYDTRPRHIGNATRWDKDWDEFCRTGLVNDNAWSSLRPKDAGVRDASNVDVPEVWLGEHARTHDAISARLLALGVPHPMRVSVIESLSDREASDIRDGRSGVTTCKPESSRALLRALTIHKPSRTRVLRATPPVTAPQDVVRPASAPTPRTYLRRNRRGCTASKMTQGSA
ncbi:hypothetical protein CesoFtcFv8_008330 [Champsocephalus esox]|uniref:Uncharacterized protein n=1 Tax=Champsocephalus esox TaxID=159716 RepID=A0AAN8CAC7_9TELE|nr:hypothetical protein CesoFtcFv8_008330 [Champsocephalus esox]